MPALTIHPDVQTLGPQPNVIREGGGYLWLVISGSNTVARFDPATGTLASNFIDVGNDRNPYDLTVDAEADRVFITNFKADTVTVARASDGEVLAELDDPAFVRPEGIAHTDEHLYVANAHFVGGEVGFEEGSVAVVERSSRQVVGTLETAAKNPQFLRRVDTPDGPRIAVTSSGVIDIGAGDGQARVTSPGGLELWRPDAEVSEANRRSFTLETRSEQERDSRIGAPGRALPAPDGRHLYFTSATAPVVFKFDMQTGEWVRGTDDPIRLYETDRNALHHGRIGPNGLLWVTAFNRDAMWVVDTRCDEVVAGPIELGAVPDFVEGPHGLAFDKTGGSMSVYYIMSTAHTLGRIDL